MSIKAEVEQLIKEQIDPLLSDNKLMDTFFSLLMNDDFAHRLIDRLFSGQPSELIQILQKDPTITQSKNRITIFNSIAYMIAVETDSDLLVDELILLLVAKGIDFHVDGDLDHKFIRHVMNLGDLESVSVTLGAKLDFLDNYGMTCFSTCIDRRLRNKIAHGDYLIDNEGKFRTIEKKGRKEVDLKSKLEKLECFNNLMATRLYDALVRIGKVPPLDSGKKDKDKSTATA